MTSFILNDNWPREYAPLLEAESPDTDGDPLIPDLDGAFWDRISRSRSKTKQRVVDSQPAAPARTDEPRRESSQTTSSEPQRSTTDDTNVVSFIYPPPGWNVGSPTDTTTATAETAEACPDDESSAASEPPESAVVSRSFSRSSTSDPEESWSTLIRRIYITRRNRAFPLPELDMVTSRTPSSTWHTVAMKVVAANRFRKGIGHHISIEDFRIEELGGRTGTLVFGPMSVFNGNVSLKVKKQIKDVKLEIVWRGVTEMTGGVEAVFIESRMVLYTGDLHDGIRSFLFAFNFPHINLPPTSETPRIAYYFVARLVPLSRPGSLSTPAAPGSAASSVRSFTTTPEKDGYSSKPARMIFIPYIDPALEVPLVSRKPSMRKKRSRDLSLKNGKKKKLPDTPSAYTLQLSDYTTSGAPTVMSGDSSKPPNTPLSFPKPKLTLTTADLPSGESSNSTPVIDRPHPSTLSSDLTRTTRITDDDNKTLAKLTVELPKSRFLPGEDIALKINLQTSPGVPLPKGIGIRVVERRYLATEANAPKTSISLLSTTADEDIFPDDDANRADEDAETYKLRPYGKEQLRVLTGKKFLLYPDQATPLKHASSDSDKGLDGGQEVEQMMVVKLPPFKNFISELLLPSCALPLGDPRIPGGTSLDGGEDAPPTSEPVINGKGKAPEIPRPVASTSNSSAAPSTTTSASHETQPEELIFRVTHIIQITIPMGPTHWYSRHSSLASTITGHHSHSRSGSSASATGSGTGSSLGGVLKDLDVTVPVIIGNKNPSQGMLGRGTPEVRINSVEGGSRGTRYESEGSGGSFAASMSGAGTSGSGSQAGPSGSGSGSSSRRGTTTTTSSSITGTTLASASGSNIASGSVPAIAGPSGSGGGSRSRSLARSDRSFSGRSLGGRSTSGKSGGSGGTEGSRMWKEGERFWTLRDGREGLGWVADHF